ncbi:UvrD-helicase domain-containing protein [Paenibacillus dendritiformis]|uniref:UvrD-helicase domain-containing protein n=1 Tax=Paenibacillus dendritiformis TaxID=130049 RepID=UPI00387E1D4A
MLTYEKAQIADNITSVDIVSDTDPDASFFRALESKGTLLNERQVEAVRHGEGPALVLAAAGSGKTSVLTSRCNYLISQFNVKSILLLTFTNKAATEMVERIGRLSDMSKEEADNITAGTFHSVFLSILRQNGVTKEIWSSGKAKEITIKTILRKLGMEKFFEPEVILGQISSYKNKLINIKNAPQETKYQKDFVLIWKEYERHKEQNQLIDFDDMLLLTYELFKEKPEVLEAARNKFHYILVDEFQDTNLAQYELVKMIAWPRNNIFAVGDDFQCQPEGTQVLTSEGYVPIEKLDPNSHKLVSYDHGKSVVIGFKNGYSFKKASREYDGQIAKIKVDGKESRSTPEHKWLVKWTQRAKEKTHVVYLMKQGEKFRIGWCKLFSTKGAFHLGVRSNIEKADAAWILKATDDRTEASMWESYLSTKYGIPLITFEPVNNAIHYNKETIDKVFKLCEKFLPQRAAKCLEELGRDLNFPIWTPDKAFGQRGGKSIMEVETCNLISGLFNIPVHLSGKKAVWTPIEVTHEHYKGTVYSLEVEKYHLYIADGMVTHNCIYGFNGARSENMLKFKTVFPDAKVIPLEINYRSTDYIVGLGTDIINKNTEQMKKNVLSVKSSNNKPNFREFMTAEEEASFLVNEIEDLVKSKKQEYKDIAILYRNNSNSRAVFDELLIRKIPFVQFGGNQLFYEDAIVKPVIAYLRLSLKPSDSKSIEQILPTLYLKKDLIKYIGSQQLKNPLNNPIEHLLNYNLKPFQLNKVREKIGMIKRLSNYKPVIAINMIREDYEKYLLGEENEATTTLHKEILKETLNELVSSSARFETIEEYIGFINQVIKNSIIQKEMQKNPNSDSLKLMTIHRSKGLEFNRVYIIHCSEGVIPSAVALEECKDVFTNDVNYNALSEERRLMYVGVTRAKENLTVSSLRLHRGKPVEPSRFIQKYIG